MQRPSLLLAHGAATGAWVWDAWRRELGAKGWQVNVIDLRGHGRSLPTDLSAVTMEDYVADLASVTVQIERARGLHPIVGGWSLGGMVAMMYAAQHPETPALLLYDPMVPAELRKADMDSVRRFSGPILTPASFGIYPADRERSRSALFDLDDGELDACLKDCDGAEESGIAYRQTLRGISIPPGAIKCPSLVISPDADAANTEANKRLADYLGGEILSVPATGHWGIVCHGSAVASAAIDVDEWLRRVVGSSFQPEEGAS